ncbi:hypothetical protein OP10G_1237 [Fimbriimonas ginsengisoli Gsoil 348]|uniref:Uncharacterized protein n=1 Tax=Fimbriimonas ginsengisoli Gsoil 348 TaxID=661478 RepID=A0A068NPF6_FIMGI|nr:hypothetical protein OP10G_1237 [Fimbriimonas ginsengisoli Gsoil 348]
MPLLSLTALSHGQTTPERSLAGFVEAWNRKDLPAAARFIYGADPKADFSAFNKLTASQPWPILHVSNVKATVNRGTASLTYSVKVEIPGGPPAQNEVATARIFEGKWLLIPLQATGKPSKFLPGVAFMVAHPGHRVGSDSTSALIEVKQLALGALLLANDSNSVFALSDANATSKLRPYLKNPALWTAPGDPKGTQSFHLNPAVAGKSMSSIPIPARTVLLYDGKNGQLRFRWNGRAAVAFVDGHAKLVTREEAARLRWKP